MKHFFQGLAPVATGVLVLLAGCKPPPSHALQGYIEAEFVRVSAPLAGTLSTLSVTRGQQVQPGAALFELEHASDAAAQVEAAQRLSQAESRLANLRKGRRPTEISALEARLRQARTSTAFSEAELARHEKLFADQVISRAELDRARAQHDADRSSADALAADLATAALGARDDEIRAAEADVEAARAALARAQWAIDQKQRTAPAAARVHDTLFRCGEFVPAGAPVVVLLPPSHLKVRFFVPQVRLAEVQAGAQVEVRIDGEPTPRWATVNYVSSQVEFTPPVIYSRENRSKLVLMVEAAFPTNGVAGLHPGQPVDVLLARKP
jgi:HlyD family secretion protein